MALRTTVTRLFLPSALLAMLAAMMWATLLDARYCVPIAFAAFTVGCLLARRAA